MQFKYLIILFSTLCITFLYLITLFNKPTAITITDIASYENKEVIIQGIVIDQRTTQYGNHILTLQDHIHKNATISLYIEGTTIAEYGDNIQATGVVQQYQNTWELVVNNPRYISIQQKWQNQSIPLKYLATNPDNYVGMNINTTGILDRIYDTFFYLTDEEQQHTLCISTDHTQHNSTPGDTLLLGGRFIYDTATLRYILQITDENHYIIIKKIG